MIYPPAPKFSSNYSIDWDRNILYTALNRICFEVYNKMKPLVGEQAIDAAAKDVKIEFTDNRNHPILGGALGKAWKDGNVNYSPVGIGKDRLMLTLYSGVISMEWLHTIFKRLIPTGYAWIDVIHWLYNEDHLYTIDYASQWNLKYFGGSLRLVLPDMVYGWQHLDEIMDGIRTGKYKEGNDKYSSDPAYAGPEPTQTAATDHELEHIRNYLVFGSTKAHH